MLASQALLYENKKSSNKMLPQCALILRPQPLGSDALQSHWGMCYLGDLRSAYGNALLALTKWSESKTEVVQEQKTIKDIPRQHMAQKAEHRIQMAEVLVSMLTGVTFCCWMFLFSCSKASDLNNAINYQFCVFLKNSIDTALARKVIDTAFTQKGDIDHVDTAITQKSSSTQRSPRKRSFHRKGHRHSVYPK